jgi:PTS system glucose-specific IIA component
MSAGPGERAPLAIRAPLPGRAVPLASVPDEVFAQAMVGPGAAIDPRPRQLDALAPVDGTLMKLHPHAFVVLAADARGVLVHLGLDTVQLEGKGFTLLAEEGDPVAAGQPLVRWNPAEVASGGRSPVCPVIALEATPEALTELLDDGEVTPGRTLFTWR